MCDGLAGHRDVLFGCLLPMVADHGERVAALGHVVAQTGMARIDSAAVVALSPGVVQAARFDGQRTVEDG